MARICLLFYQPNHTTMKTAKQPAAQEPTTKSKIQTPVPPQVEYPLEKPDSKKNQDTQPGHSNK